MNQESIWGRFLKKSKVVYTFKGAKNYIISGHTNKDSLCLFLHKSSCAHSTVQVKGLLQAEEQVYNLFGFYLELPALNWE
jgi:hypothetical protein